MIKYLIIILKININAYVLVLLESMWWCNNNAAKVSGISVRISVYTLAHILSLYIYCHIAPYHCRLDLDCELVYCLKLFYYV